MTDNDYRSAILFGLVLASFVVNLLIVAQLGRFRDAMQSRDERISELQRSLTVQEQYTETIATALVRRRMSHHGEPQP